MRFLDLALPRPCRALRRDQHPLAVQRVVATMRLCVCLGHELELDAKQIGRARGWTYCYAIRLTPRVGWVTYTSGRIPVMRLYSDCSRSDTSRDASWRTRFTVQPPKPPPVMRAPTTSGSSRAISTSVSSSGQLT